MANEHIPTTPEVRAWMREQQRRWRAENPERARLQRLRSYKNALERLGFVITGGSIDLQTGKPRCIDTNGKQGGGLE